MTRLLLLAAILALASCSRYDPMPKWAGYSIEVKK
jgi:hypothetical protein